MRRSSRSLLSLLTCLVFACFGDAPGVESSTGDTGHETGAPTSSTTQGHETSTTTSSTDPSTSSTASTASTTSTSSGSATSDEDTTEGTASTGSDETTSDEHCAALVQLEPPFVAMFDVESTPVAGGAIKFVFDPFDGDYKGIEIAEAGVAISHQENACVSLFFSPHYAAHCGVPDAGWYCAYLTSRENRGAPIRRHAALLFEVAGGDPPSCEAVLGTCDAGGGWGDACSCDDP
jgi:hypothetical protein